MKKNIGYIIGGAVIVVALIVMLVFVFSGETPQQDPVELDLTGAWKVVSYVDTNTGAATLYEGDSQEYMVFTADTCSDYRGDLTTPFASSKYELADTAYGDKALKLTDLSMEYTIEVKTENLLRFYNSANTYMALVRYPNADLSATDLDNTVLTGRWNVDYRNTGEAIAQEEMVFDNGKLTDYRNGESTPTVEAEYSWVTADHLSAPSLGMDYWYIPYSTDRVFLVEKVSGFVWELSKVG